MSLRKALLASVGSLVLAGSAYAADLPVRAAPPPPPPVPIFTWTGFYVGVNAGYGWNTNSNNNAFYDPYTGFVYGGSGGNDGGFVGGGQVGYNYQFGQFVAGIEADIQYADLKNNNNNLYFGGIYGLGGHNRGIEWFGTVRARLGFAIDRALIYATGGFAYGGGGGNNNAYYYNGFYYGGSGDDSRTGWTLGAGVEYAFTDNIIARVEGLYVNLGKNGNDVLPIVYNNRKDTEFGVVRAGLSYKFSTF